MRLYGSSMLKRTALCLLRVTDWCFRRMSTITLAASNGARLIRDQQFSLHLQCFISCTALLQLGKSVGAAWRAFLRFRCGRGVLEHSWSSKEAMPAPNKLVIKEGRAGAAVASAFSIAPTPASTSARNITTVCPQGD